MTNDAMTHFLVLSPALPPPHLCPVTTHIQHLLILANLLLLARDAWQWWQLRQYLKSTHAL